MPSAFDLGGLSWKELGKRVVNAISEDDVTGRAAELAYYFFLAIFPGLIFLAAILGIVAAPGSQIRTHLLEYLTRAMPSGAGQLVTRTFDQTTRSTGSGKLSFGIIAALWSASAGMAALSDALNAVHNVREGRAYIVAKLNALWLTIATSLLILAAIVIVLYGGNIANMVGGSIGLGSVATLGWKIVQWPVALFFLFVAFGLVYYFAPDVHERHWHWITPGAIVGVFLWLIVSFALRVYLHFFNSYSATYGALGAVIILLLWFYVTGLAILIGEEINTEIETAAAQHGEPRAVHKGEKAA